MATTMDNGRAAAFEPEMQDRVGTSRETPGWDLATERRIDDGKTLARQIAFFSIALGAVELAAAEKLCRALGVSEDRADLVRLYGVREVAKGLGILRSHHPEGWLWARIAGDMLDLGTLAAALGPRNRKSHRVKAAMLAVAGVTALDVICARQLGKSRVQPG